MIIWKTIKNYDKYEVSNTGLIRTIDRTVVKSNGRVCFLKGKLLKPGIDKLGYARVNLCKDGKPKSFLLSRLICEAFNGEAPIGSNVCRHLDGNPRNNIPTNLQWGTVQENIDDTLIHGTRSRGSRNGHAKLTEADVAEITAKAASGMTQAEIAILYRVNPSQISRAINRIRWKHV